MPRTAIRATALCTSRTSAQAASRCRQRLPSVRPLASGSLSQGTRAAEDRLAYTERPRSRRRTRAVTLSAGVRIGGSPTLSP